MEKFFKGFLIGGFLTLIFFFSLTFLAFGHLDKTFTESVSQKLNDVPSGLVKTYLINKNLLGFFPGLTMTVPEHTRSLFNGASEIERTAYNATLDALFKLPPNNDPFQLIKKESAGTLSPLEKMGIEWRGTIFESGFYFWGCVVLSIAFFLVYFKFCEPIFSFYVSTSAHIKNLIVKKAPPQQQEVIKPESIPEISPEEKERIEQERKETELKKKQEEAERRAREKAKREREAAEEAARIAEELAQKKKKKRDMLNKI